MNTSHLCKWGEKASCLSLRYGCCSLIPLDRASLFAAHVGSVALGLLSALTLHTTSRGPADRSLRGKARSAPLHRPARHNSHSPAPKHLPNPRLAGTLTTPRPGGCRAAAITQQDKGRMQKLGDAKGEPAAWSSRASASQRESGRLLREGIHPHTPGASNALFKAPVAAGRGISSTELTG